MKDKRSYISLTEGRTLLSYFLLSLSSFFPVYFTHLPSHYSLRSSFCPFTHPPSHNILLHSSLPPFTLHSPYLLSCLRCTSTISLPSLDLPTALMSDGIIGCHAPIITPEWSPGALWLVQITPDYWLQNNWLVMVTLWLRGGVRGRGWWAEREKGVKGTVALLTLEKYHDCPYVDISNDTVSPPRISSLASSHFYSNLPLTLMFLSLPTF